MFKNWQILSKYSPGLENKFPEIHPVILQLLANRELLDQKSIDKFLGPDYSQDICDPYLFRDMEKAVLRIFAGIEKNEKIVVHGDYDADGVSASAILMTTLEAIGASKIDVYLPHREEEGYGLRIETIEKLAAAGTNLIITCDCGISNLAEAKLAKKKNIDLIITDHHHVPEETPEAYAIIHPQFPGERYPSKELVGATVAFKLAQGLVQEAAKRKRRVPQDILGNVLDWDGFSKWLLDLVAIATVADIGILKGENRTLVKYGLIVLNKTRRLGLQELFRKARIGPFSSKIQALDTYNIGFQIAPRLNAAGRINHANVAYKLIMSRTSAEAKVLAEELEATNTERQKVTERILKEALEQIKVPEGKEKILFAYFEDWPLGVIGLVAGKISDKYYLPTILMCKTKEGMSGSGRSIPDFNIIEALEKSSNYLDRFGGHPQACGFTLAQGNDLAGFKKRLNELASEELEGKTLKPTLLIEAEIVLEDINWEFFEELEKFIPFGEGNRLPLFLSYNLEVCEIRGVGKNGDHLRLMAKSRNGKMVKLIGFCLGNSSRNNGTDWCQKLKISDHIDVVYEVGVNEWNGNRELQLKIIDLRLHEGK